MLLVAGLLPFGVNRSGLRERMSPEAGYPYIHRVSTDAYSIRPSNVCLRPHLFQATIVPVKRRYHGKRPPSIPFLQMVALCTCEVAT